MTTGHDHGQPVAQTTDSDESLLDQLASFIATNTDEHANRFDIEQGGTLTVNIANLIPEGQALARNAFDAWSLVSGIQFEFVEGVGVEDRAHIFIDDDDEKAPARHSTYVINGEIYSAINISEDIILGNSPLDTFLHEIGHALGLAHPGNYEGPTYVFEDDAMFANDSYHTTVMSYFPQSRNPNIVQTVTTASPETPQIADIIAIQMLYGKPESANPGDTTYGVDANTGSYLDEIFASWTGPEKDVTTTLTIYDTHGFDTLDYSTDDTDQRIDLNPEGVSDVFTNASLGTIIIARDTIIERYVAGSGDDNVTGNIADNVLEGRDGDDTLMGGHGNDTLIGGPGADALGGDAGLDTASYAGSDAAVTVNLSDGTATGGDAEGDTFTSIENLTGSAFDDTLIGDAAENVLEGGDGADTLDGGAGADTASYAASDLAVSVDLSTGTKSGGHAAGDTLTSIENLSGSRYSDVLTGDAGANRLDGGAGNDRLTGGAGADVLVGGPGADAAYYASSAAAVTVNLLDGTGTGGDAEGDTLDSIEYLSGSAFDDTLIGDAGNNVLSGRAGADTFDGGEGTDTVSYSGSNAGVTVNLLTGAGERGHAQGDMLFNIENLIGSRYNDDLTGDTGNNVLRAGAGDDVLIGGAGADRLQGGTGQDTVSYTDSPAGVKVRLHTLYAKGGDATGDTFPGLLTVAFTDADGVAQTDSLPDVENLIGSPHNDILAGDRRDNVLDGGFGDDKLYGGPGGGDDVMAGGLGNDRLFGGQGDDTLIGGQGDDRLAGGPGNDVFVFGPGEGADTVTDFSSGTDKVDLTAFEIESVEDVTMTTGNDGVTVDLGDIDGGTILLADLTTVPDAGDFLV